MGLRERRQERREDRQTFRPGGGAIQFQLQQRLVSLGDDYWIETSTGDRAYKIDGKALRVRKTLIFEDPAGNELARIQDRPVHIRESMEIEGPDGSNIATIKKAMITPLRERYSVSVSTGPDLEVQGNVVDHEYEITTGHDKLAEVSKKWFRLRDSYGVQVEPGQDVILMLALAVALDTMAH